MIICLEGEERSGGLAAVRAVPGWLNAISILPVYTPLDKTTNSSLILSFVHQEGSCHCHLFLGFVQTEQHWRTNFPGAWAVFR